MRNARPNLRKRRFVRFAAVAAYVAAALGVLPAAVRAQDPTHWLTPSRRALDKGMLFTSGIPKQSEAAVPQDRERLLREGAVLYGTHCSTCHGGDLAGTEGVPSLLQAGGAGVDFYITTGRMPLALRGATEDGSLSAFGRTTATGAQAPHGPPLFDARQTAALDAYVDARAARRTRVPAVRLDSARLQRGRRIFEDNCQACHGAAAQGATAGEHWVALPLYAASPTQIGEAIRIGPGVMPRFTPAQLSDADIDAVATYVRYLADAPQRYGGLEMDYLGPVSEGAISAFIGVGFLFWVIYFTGTKADGRRVNELDRR